MDNELVTNHLSHTMPNTSKKQLKLGLARQSWSTRQQCHSTVAETNDSHPPDPRRSALLLLGAADEAPFYRDHLRVAINPTERYRPSEKVLGTKTNYYYFTSLDTLCLTGRQTSVVSASAHPASRGRERWCYFPFGSVLKLLSKEKVRQRRSKRNTRQAPPP